MEPEDPPGPTMAQVNVDELFAKLETFYRLMHDPKAARYGITPDERVRKLSLMQASEVKPGRWQKLLQLFKGPEPLRKVGDVFCWEAVHITTRSGSRIAILVGANEDANKSVQYVNVPSTPSEVVLLTKAYLLSRPPEDVDALLSKLSSTVRDIEDLEAIRIEEKRRKKRFPNNTPKKETPNYP